ncbi:MAG TPA: hypothetical protein PKN44_13095 [Bacteroidales bacterium]|nr:hypothetical protein [Bacteroidales bacterium]HPS51720.1 hypothetical protein [Bacteroidales bacterium]
MKDTIKKYFKEDRTHKTGVSLYMKYGKRLAFKRQLNVTPASAYITGVLHEELRQLIEMDSKEFNLIMSKPVFIPKAKPPVTPEGTDERHPLPPVKEPPKPSEKKGKKVSRKK